MKTCNRPTADTYDELSEAELLQQLSERLSGTCNGPTAPTPDRRAIITEALHKIDDLDRAPGDRREGGHRTDRGGRHGLPVPRRGEQPGAVLGLVARRPKRHRAGSRPTGGTPTRSSPRITPSRARSATAKAASSPAGSPTSSTRSSSRSPRAKRPQWTRSSGCSSKLPGKRWRTPGIAAAQHSRDANLGVRRRHRLRLHAHDVAGRLRPEDLDAYIPTGNSANFAAGRMAYMLGARGPAVVLDTACSSSLVAVHLACQSLRWRESDTALVGGTNLLLSPGNQHRVLTVGNAVARKASARPSTRAPTGMCAARAPAWWCSSGWPTRNGTATASSPWCAVRRSTRTAPAAG